MGLPFQEECCHVGKLARFTLVRRSERVIELERIGGDLATGFRKSKNKRSSIKALGYTPRVQSIEWLSDHVRPEESGVRSVLPRCALMWNLFWITKAQEWRKGSRLKAVNFLLIKSHLLGNQIGNKGPNTWEVVMCDTGWVMTFINFR